MTVFLRAAAAALVIATFGCDATLVENENESPTAPAPPSGVTQLQIVDLRAGTGLEAAIGRTVFVHYIGWLYDSSKTDNKGAQFDTSLNRGPFSFTLGAGQVIRGWDQGVAGMRVGGIRRLIIPPSLGYGSSPNGPIPANSTLVFDVELLDVR